MTIQVTGTLRDPIGDAIPNTPIRVVALLGSPNILPEAVVVTVTDANGLYDFPLEDGTYLIDWLVDGDEYEIAGTSIVNTGTPSPVNLTDLFLYTTPLDPTQVTDLQAEFQQLIDDLEGAFDTETQEIRDQLVDGDASTLQTAQTFTNDRLGAELATITAQVVAGDASVLSQSTSYSDVADNLLAADITTVEAANVATQFSLTATIDAQAIENAAIRGEVTAGDADVTSNMEAYADAAVGVSSATLTNAISAGDAAVTVAANAYSDSNDDTLEATLRAVVSVAEGNVQAIAEAYTVASLGYLDGGTGLWVDGPLSASYRNHTITTNDGEQGTISEVMSIMAKPGGGGLVALGSVTSDVNGRVTGYYNTNDGLVTNFDIVADNFSVGHLDGGNYVQDMGYNTVTKLLEVSGDIILDGTLSGDKIIANSIQAEHMAAGAITADSLTAGSITGDKISSSTTIIAGSGLTSAGMNGYNDGSNYGTDDISFWAGEWDYDAHVAPYRVYNDGRLFASNATISGSISTTAITSSTFNAGTITASVIEGSTIIGTQFLYFCDPYGNGTKFYYINNPTVALQCVQTVSEIQNYSHNPYGAGSTLFGGTGVTSWRVNMRTASDTVGGIDTNRARNHKVKANWLRMNYHLNSGPGQGNTFFHFRVVFRNTITGARQESAWANFPLGSTNGIGTGNNSVSVAGMTFTFHSSINSFYGSMTSSAGSLGSPTAPIEVLVESYAGNSSVNRSSSASLTIDVDNDIIIPQEGLWIS